MAAIADMRYESFPFKLSFLLSGACTGRPSFWAIIQRIMISPEEVEYVARLARLRFDDDELARLRPELARIIEYVHQLSELDLSGLEPTAHAVPLKNVFRVDEPEPGLAHEKAVGPGPKVERGQFVVPRIG